MPEVFDKIPTNFIYEDSSGTFWVVSKEQGIFRLNKDFTAVDRLKLRVPIEIREDKYDNLWVSTLGAGLFRLSLGVMRSYTKENGLTGAPVYPIFQRQDGTILFGSFGSGVLEFKDEKISQYKTIDGKSVTRSVTSIIETKSKELWFYLYGKGLVNIKGDKVIKAFKSENGLPSNTGMTLLEDRENNIWGSTVRGDLFKIDSNHNIKVYSSNEKLDLNTISSITEDSKGNKWIATAKGVAIFDGLEFTSFKPKLIFSRVLSISHYDKMVIITGYQGIFILKGDKVHHINHNYGLYANTVFASVIDDFGRLWFTSNNGVFSIDSTELDKFIKNNEKPKIRSYSIEDGLSSIECAGGSQFNLIKDKKGQIWFPTVNGVSVIDPKNLLAPPQKPFVKFKTILFDNKKESLENKKEIFIEPRVKWITIPINSITHHISKKIKYRYRLKNYDEQWLSLENNEVRISALPSGKYTLELSATDSMGNWLKPITIKLNFIPHFYEKPIFFIVLTPFIILLILFYIKLRTRRIVLKNQELEDLIAERTEKIKELSLSDPLTVLRNRRFVDEIIKPKLCQYFSQKEYDLSNADNRVQASNNSGYAIFLLDIDHFKNVNDVYGHDAGDCVLIQFARLLKENVRKDDFIIRWGGEEFLIILSNTKFESLDKFASKLKEKIENYEFDLGEGKKIFKTASAGYLYFPFIPSSPLFLKFEDGVKLADQGLYYAKENGRNKFVGFKFNKVIPDIEDLPVLLKDVDKGVEKEFFNMEVID